MAANKKTIRIQAKAIFKGTLTAAGISMIAIVCLAIVIKFFRISDRHISIINQVFKVISIVFGSLFAVGIGGTRGLTKGALTGICYMILGYGMSLAVSGDMFSIMAACSDAALGAATGAACGALCSNAGKKNVRRKNV